MTDISHTLQAIRCARHAHEPAFALDLQGRAPSPETISRWLQGLGRLQQAVAGTPEFFQIAAKAVVETVGLDSGTILLKRENGWEVESQHRPASLDQPPELHWSIIKRVTNERCSYFHDAQLVARTGNGAVATAAVSPIFDDKRIVIGVVYGDRLPHSKSQRRGIRPLEAQLMQLVAETVTVGLERFRREAEIVQTRAWLAQAFSPEIVRELEQNPQLLAGQEREITVLFGDLRGFASFTESLDSATTYRLLGDVMDRLTRVVTAHCGTIIDYYGDGFAAMWNAPVTQPEQSELACRAALAMFEELPALNEKWRSTLQTELRLGVGIHRGLAQVGNAGTSQRLKYGPRGNTVNLASRVEGATKHLDVPLLVTDDVRRHLPPTFTARRVAKVQLSGISTPVDLYDLFPQPLRPDQQAALVTYEAALTAFEHRDFSRAIEKLVALSDLHIDFEMPTAFLSQCIQRHARQYVAAPNDSSQADLVIELPK